MQSANKTRSGISGARVLITGATGLLGRQVLDTFEKHGWCTRGLGLARAKGATVKCDLLNSDDVEAQFNDFKPTIVVHCAAERRPDVLEENRAYATKINVDLTRDIGKICRARGIWMIYISTNYVFDGKAAPYTEEAAPKPVNAYGESKYAGEQVLAEVHPDAATLRVPLLYGPIEYIGETSVTALLAAIQKESPKLDNWQERFPTCTVDTARVLEAFCAAFVTRGKADPNAFRGIFHWQANERHTKYTMATVIARIAGVDAASFVRVDDAPLPGQAPRPQFERMQCGRLERLLAEAGEGEPDRFRSDFAACLERHLEPFVERRRCGTTAALVPQARTLAICGLCGLGLALPCLCGALLRRGSTGPWSQAALLGLFLTLSLLVALLFSPQLWGPICKLPPLCSSRTSPRRHPAMEEP